MANKEFYFTSLYSPTGHHSAGVEHVSVFHRLPVKLTVDDHKYAHSTHFYRDPEKYTCCTHTHTHTHTLSLSLSPSLSLCLFSIFFQANVHRTCSKSRSRSSEAKKQSFCSSSHSCVRYLWFSSFLPCTREGRARNPFYYFFLFGTQNQNLHYIE